MKVTPYCSIIILNYFGERVIENVIKSLFKLDYPKRKFEIIVVDNGSKDKSTKILRKLSFKFINLRLILSEKNLGFSKGNNLGIKKAKGEFVALLNNDCIVEKNWLKELINSATKDKKIFAVNSKILLYPKFVIVKFNINPKLLPVYVWLSQSNLYDNTGTKLYYPPLWRKFNYFQMEIPCEPYRDTVVKFTILFNSRGFKFKDVSDLKNAITFENKSLNVENIKINGDDIEYLISFNLSERNIQKQSIDKIQNAGIMVFQDGYGRDIGAIVSGHKQYHEYDLKQYNKEKEVYAACGAAVLYNKKILNKIGYLDESFFMYYEDVEISERARFAGFKIVYTPRAVVRHHHALFSKEWSSFFIYHVEKGRLLHLYYNFPFRVFFLAYYALIVDSVFIPFLILFKLKIFIYMIKTKKKESGEPNFIRRIQMTRALAFFIIYSPFLLIRKFQYNQTRKKGAVNNNYLKILKGDWYFS